MLKHGLGHERCTVPADEDRTARELLFREPREIDDFGHVGQIVTGKADRIGTTLLQQRDERRVRLHLQIDERDVVPGPARGGCDELKPQRFQAQINFRIHQWAWMDEQHVHTLPPSMVVWWLTIGCL